MVDQGAGYSWDCEQDYGFASFPWEGEKEKERGVTIACVNINTMTEVCKRKGVFDIFTRGNLDVLNVREMLLNGCGFEDCKKADRKGLWEGIARVVWA